MLAQIAIPWNFWAFGSTSTTLISNPEFERFRSHAGLNHFRCLPTKWVAATGAIWNLREGRQMRSLIASPVVKRLGGAAKTNMSKRLSKGGAKSWSQRCVFVWQQQEVRVLPSVDQQTTGSTRCFWLRFLPATRPLPCNARRTRRGS